MAENPGFTYLVNFLGGTRETRSRLDSFEKHQEDITFLYTKEPMTPGEADVIVLPVFEISLIPEIKKNWLPIIAYGPGDALDMAFTAGCTDYLKMPWYSEELYHRIRRAVKSRSITLPWGRISISYGHVASSFGRVKLSSQELAIFKVLAQQQGDVVPREVLYYAIWGKLKKQSRVADMHISHLRKKIQTLLPSNVYEPLIKSVYGYGYFIPSHTFTCSCQKHSEGSIAHLYDT